MISYNQGVKNSISQIFSIHACSGRVRKEGRRVGRENRVFEQDALQVYKNINVRVKALEIIRLGISSGMTISDALQYAQKHSPRGASQELEQALNQFQVGFPLSRGLEEIAIANSGWRSISDTIITSLQSGSPITDQLADVEFVLQSSIDTEKLKRIKSVAVKSVLPLGLCFLPAFILLAVIPIVAGLIGGITQ